MKIPKNIREELKNFDKTKVPRCPTCHKNFVHAVDSITGELSEYLWRYDCEHDTGAVLMIG